MEFPDTYDFLEKIKEYCGSIGLDFLRAKSRLTPNQTWNSFGPPATTSRWCCSVHKTSPQVNLLQQITHNSHFTGMAFTGIRGDESTARSEYESISFGEKHKGQYSCHPLLEWNSAELYLYIFGSKLMLNEAYKKGNSRAGCLVCPMSSGKHEYIKRYNYPAQVDTFTDLIKATSGKTQFSDNEMKSFINEGNWKNRRSGRELNFGQDKFSVDITKNGTIITVYFNELNWQEWASTIGKVMHISKNSYTIDYCGKPHNFDIRFEENSIIFSFPYCATTKEDIKFLSLFRSVIIKSIYCINCGVCEAECPNDCIDMKQELKISDKCIHCNHCHDVREHCLRYNSIRNKLGGEKKMKGLDRYFSFGIRQNWLHTFIKYNGGEEFWLTDGDSEVANKKKDAFLNFAKDASLVAYDKSAVGDKYTKCKPSAIVGKIEKLGANSETSWGLLLSNLVYTPQFNWYIHNVKSGTTYTPDHIKLLLEEVMENDTKGLGKRNIVDAFKMFLVKTPLGGKIGFGVCDYKERVSLIGNETITLNSITRGTWQNPDPLVILYSLYKFAEACGDYYQFTLTRLLNHDIDSDGVSPTEIFGLDRSVMEKILSGLAINYPGFISASFTLDLDNITLRSDKTSADVLTLF
jgi:phosphoadenosine phosphosulfate reductase